MLNLNKWQQQRGIGLLELMLSLAIIAILIIMATRYYQSAKQSSDINNAIDQINAVAAGAATWKVGRANYTGIAMDDMQKNGMIPAGWVGCSGQTCTGANVYAGDITVAGGANLTVTLTAVPKTACDLIAARIQGAAKDATDKQAQCTGGSVVVTFGPGSGSTS